MCATEESSYFKGQLMMKEEVITLTVEITDMPGEAFSFSSNPGRGVVRKVDGTWGLYHYLGDQPTRQAVEQIIAGMNILFKN